MCLDRFVCDYCEDCRQYVNTAKHDFFWRHGFEGFSDFLASDSELPLVDYFFVGTLLPCREQVCGLVAYQVMQLTDLLKSMS